MIIFEQHWMTKITRVISAKIIFKLFELVGIRPSVALQALQRKNTPMIAIIFLVSLISVLLDTDVSVNSSKVLLTFLT